MLDFIISCRNGNYHNYDVVVGGRADDTIYEYIEGYYEGQVNKKKLFELMKTKYPDLQISFIQIRR